MSVKVAIRVRPFNQREISLGTKCCVQMIENKTKLISSQGQKQHAKRQFGFDYSLWSHDGFTTLQNGLMVPINDKYWDQTRVFNEIGTQIINNAWLGYNCCLFAYGQTGSGKSYSMLGYGYNKGIVPLSCQQIFLRMNRNVQSNKIYYVTMSMIQIYNEKVQDLLIPASKRPKGGLQIRENKTVGVYVQGITKHKVNSFKQIEKWMDEGSKNRSLASTQMNEYSSRAHTIISIEFIQREQINKNQITQKTSTIHLIDLAGSERVGKTGLTNSDRLKQAGNINKSLHHLGLVIQILAEKSQGKRKNQIVPYRSSSLTRILQNSLGGNSKTIMICAISPSSDNYEESYSTLKYADQVKKIKNNATINQTLTDKIIRELKQQNNRLKNLIKQYNDRSTISPNDINKLEQAKQEQKFVQRNLYRTSFAVKQFGLSCSQDQNLLTNLSGIDEQDNRIDISHDETSFLQSDLFKLDQPYITNVNEDQMLTGRVKYSVDPQIIIGRKQAIPTPHVILGAIGIQKLHAKIYKKQDKVYISTYNQNASDRTYVNGENVYYQTELFHNDRIIFGASCVFLMKLPTQIGRKGGYINQNQLNFQFAISELESLQKNKSILGEEELNNKLKLMQQQIEKQKKIMEKKIKEQRMLYEQQIKIIKQQRENEMKSMLIKLKKKEQQSKKLEIEQKEMKLIKQKTKKLQLALQNQRKKKQQLEEKLIQSAMLEIEFENSKLKQKQRIKQQQKLKDQMQRILKQKEKVEQNQRKIRKQKQQQERSKLQYQRKIKQIQAIEQQQKQQERIQKILEKKMEICQNLNIIQQRFYQVKKCKKQIEELRIKLYSKEKNQLQKKLLDILPLITEINLITHQMNREIQFETKIDYEYFGMNEMTECLKNSGYKSKIKLKIQVDNHQEGRIYFWNIQRFKNRFDIAKDMLEKYYENPRNPIFFDKDHDPFWDPPQPELIGQSFLALQHLMYNLDYHNPTLKIIGGMTSKGQISVRICPTNAQGSQNLSRKQQKQDLIFFPRSLLNHDLHFKLNIDKFRLTENVIEAYIEYEILQGNYKYLKFQTPKIPKKDLGKQLKYQRVHTLKQVSESTLYYLSKSQIVFKVYATKKVHELKQTSSTFAFSSANQLTKQEQEDQTNNYFVDGFVDDLDDRTSLKSEALQHRNHFNKSVKYDPRIQLFPNAQQINHKMQSDFTRNEDMKRKISDKLQNQSFQKGMNKKIPNNKATITANTNKSIPNGSGHNTSNDNKDQKCIIF